MGVTPSPAHTTAAVVEAAEWRGQLWRQWWRRRWCGGAVVGAVDEAVVDAVTHP